MLLDLFMDENGNLDKNVFTNAYDVGGYQTKFNEIKNVIIKTLIYTNKLRDIALGMRIVNSEAEKSRIEKEIFTFISNAYWDDYLTLKNLIVKILISGRKVIAVFVYDDGEIKKMLFEKTFEL